MSEQNILNPTAASVMNPHYSIPHKDPATDVSWQARSGQEYDRDMLVRGMEWQLHWDKVPFSTYQSLRQWFRQYRKGFFSYFDIDDNRYYSGKFLAEPQFERVGNNQVNVSATFVEIPKVAMFQYPGNWGVDSIFVEERGDYGQDLVKLTGTWDHGDKNYVLWSEQFDNAAWTKANATVTPNVVTDPNGGATADSVAFSVTGSTAQLTQTVTTPFPVGGQRVTLSIWLKAASGTPSITLQVFDATGTTSQVFALSTAWQRVSISVVLNDAATALTFMLLSPTSNAIAYHVWGAQLEFGGTGAASTYTQTTGAAAALLAAQQNVNYHNGFAYFDPGTVTTDAAEWIYVGYGFRVWAPKNAQMGIMQVFLDGVSQGTIDLYSAAHAASSALMTVQSVSLGQHRVKLAPTNTKNASSSGFIVAADAIEVMR
jgi:hypothetical protein